MFKLEVFVEQRRYIFKFISTARNFDILKSQKKLKFFKLLVWCRQRVGFHLQFSWRWVET